MQIGDRVRVINAGTASPDTLGHAGTIISRHGTGGNWIVLLDSGPISHHIAGYDNQPAWYFYEEWLKLDISASEGAVKRRTKRMEIHFYA
jgi:hypothetical protein